MSGMLEKYNHSLISKYEDLLLETRNYTQMKLLRMYGEFFRVNLQKLYFLENSQYDNDIDYGVNFYFPSVRLVEGFKLRHIEDHVVGYPPFDIGYEYFDGEGEIDEWELYTGHECDEGCDCRALINPTEEELM